jgi:hypothetical protein
VIKDLEASVFEGCVSLESVTLSAAMEHIGYQSFTGCSSLRAISLAGSGVTEIEDNTFEDCSSLATVVLSDSVASIDFRAFQNCKRLQTINFPPALRRISSCAFEGCVSLKSVDMSAVTHIKDQAFSGCESLTVLHIPDSVTHIGANAFSGCLRLVVVHIPDSITFLGASAFCKCPVSHGLPHGAQIPCSDDEDDDDGHDPYSESDYEDWESDEEWPVPRIMFPSVQALLNEQPRYVVRLVKDHVAAVRAVRVLLLCGQQRGGPLGGLLSSVAMRRCRIAPFLTTMATKEFSTEEQVRNFLTLPLWIGPRQRFPGAGGRMTEEEPLTGSWLRGVHQQTAGEL